MTQYKLTKKRTRELMNAWITTKHELYSETKRTSDVFDYNLIDEILRHIEHIDMTFVDDGHFKELIYRIMPRIVHIADTRGFVKLIPLFVPMAFDRETVGD